MARTIRIGGQDFERIRVNNNFYIDKTDFIKKWWEAEDDVTLITRPRRFGKTLNMSMLEQFFREVNQLSAKKNAVWSLLLASGYLKVVSTTLMEETGRTYYDLVLTNREVTLMFEIMIQDWFSGRGDYNDFIKALLQDDVDGEAK